jgi:deoxycytidylate deaminase
MLITYRCPCLTCSVKIAQVGISEVVYSQEYNVDAKVCGHDPMLYEF